MFVTTYRTVYLCQRLSDQKQVIIKQIPVEQMTKEERQVALNEAKVLAMLDHPNIIEYYENFLEDKALMIVMEYAEGRLVLCQWRYSRRGGRGQIAPPGKKIGGPWREGKKEEAKKRRKEWKNTEWTPLQPHISIFHPHLHSCINYSITVNEFISLGKNLLPPATQPTTTVMSCTLHPDLVSA